jgi:hypothetical protein
MRPARSEIQEQWKAWFSESSRGGEARWLGVQPEGQAEQPRVLLLRGPYALKAGDAQTLGGLPSSAFVLAAPPDNGATAVAVALLGQDRLPLRRGAVSGRQDSLQSA